MDPHPLPGEGDGAQATGASPPQVHAGLPQCLERSSVSPSRMWAPEGPAAFLSCVPATLQPNRAQQGCRLVVACGPWCSNAGRAPGGVSGRPAVALILTPPQGLRLLLSSRPATRRTPRASADAAARAPGVASGPLATDTPRRSAL